MAGPHVSVVMPVRDGESWLSTAIESVLAQTFADFELIVIDNGSLDRTPAIVAEYAGLDRRVRYIRTGPTSLVDALNVGLAEAAAPLIARLDADDVSHPPRLERQSQFLQQHPGVLLVGSWAEVIDHAGRVISILRPPTQHLELAESLLRGNPFIHSSLMFRTNAARRAGGYRAAFAAAEDYDFLLRLMAEGELANLPETLVQYRRHAQGVSVTQPVRQVFSVRMAKRAHAERTTKGGDPAADLDAPPDLFASEADQAFYAPDAQVCRILAFADSDLITPTHLSRVDLKAVGDLLRGLKGAERKLAQAALVNLLRANVSPHRLPYARLLLTLFRLHPARALRLLPGLLSPQRNRA